MNLSKDGSIHTMGFCPARVISGTILTMKSEMEDQEVDEHLVAPVLRPRSEVSSRPVILVFCDFYLPGYKSGGSMRTLVNTIERLGDDFDFRIVTRDHDGKSDKTPYAGVRLNEWNRIGPALVRYLSPDRIRLSEVKSIVGTVDPDAIYFNSYFSTLTILVMLLRKFGKVKNTPIIVAPEGEITTAGLEMKSTKKRAFIRAATALRLYDDVIWKATSDQEAAEVSSIRVKRAKIFVAPNLSPKSILADYHADRKPVKEPGRARLVYLSRIHPVKNLDFLLDILKDVEGNVDLDVYGPVDANEDYLEKCRRNIERLPKTVSVSFKGGIDHTKVARTMFDYEFFILPTRTENFGHVFLEALAAGCPLVISDRTPWTDLESKGVGWDIPLEEKGSWIATLNNCVRMGGEDYETLSQRARAFADDWLADDELEQATRNVIEFSLGRYHG